MVKPRPIPGPLCLLGVHLDCSVDQNVLDIPPGEAVPVRGRGGGRENYMYMYVWNTAVTCTYMYNAYVLHVHVHVHVM